VRAQVNKDIEALRSTDKLGSSLQAEVELEADGELYQNLASLGDDLKFVLIVSQASVKQGPETRIAVQVSGHAKCERCWHYRADVGAHAAHPTICGRCVENIEGQGEARTHA
jgi:isoleucyl-tRNA synthetase